MRPQGVDMMWERISALLFMGREYWEKYTSMEEIKKRIKKGQYQLWLAEDSGGPYLAMLSTIDIYPKQKVLRIFWMGGTRLDETLPLLDYIELWAHRSGCGMVEVIGRWGWMRVLDKYGYDPRSVLLVKDISGIREH
jgi:hypothetical protein